MKNLIKGCKNLNRQDQRKMVDLLSPFLYGICRRYTYNHADAKDLLQEALVRIFNNLDKCSAKEEGTFKGWCRRIAINIALAKRRKKSFQLEVVGDESSLQTINPVVDSQLNVEDILNLLEQLPENQRVVFNLYVMDGYSHKEIGEMLHVKESSSRTFLTRARHSMQQLLQQEWRVKNGTN